jgi:hypothetical protein
MMDQIDHLLCGRCFVGDIFPLKSPRSEGYAVYGRRLLEPHDTIDCAFLVLKVWHVKSKKGLGRRKVRVNSWETSIKGGRAVNHHRSVMAPITIC